MRVLNALKADILFQFKQGFYLVYVLLTLLYMVLIGQVPQEIGKIAVPLIVFSDPSIVGFFFIGGIVMLEKVQGVIDYLVITPLRTREYLVAKVVSLSILAAAAGIAISMVSHKGEVNWILLVAGILLSSAFFTLYGFVAAAGCHTINQYFIRMVPYMLLIVAPCFSIIGFPYAWVFGIFPSVAGLKLVYGAFHEIAFLEAMIYVIYLLIMDVLMLHWVERVFDRRIVSGGESQ